MQSLYACFQLLIHLDAVAVKFQLRRIQQRLGGREPGHDVPAQCFFPPPKVGSCLLHLRRRERPVLFGKTARRLIREIFIYRRKQLGATLKKVAADVPAESGIEVFLPPEIFRADAFPPEENFFELESGSEIFSAGALHFRRFATKGEAFAPLVASQFRQALEIPVGGALFAWFFPEDALGFLKTPPATAG